MQIVLVLKDKIERERERERELVIIFRSSVAQYLFFSFLNN